MNDFIFLSILYIKTQNKINHKSLLRLLYTIKYQFVNIIDERLRIKKINVLFQKYYPRIDKYKKKLYNVVNIDVWNFIEYYKPSDNPLFLTFDDTESVLKYICPNISHIKNICLFKINIPFDSYGDNKKKYKILCIKRKKQFHYRLGIKSLYDSKKSKHYNDIIKVREIYYDVLQQIMRCVKLILANCNVVLYQNTFSFIENGFNPIIKGTGLMLRYATSQDKISPRVPQNYYLIEIIDDRYLTDVEYLCEGRRVPFRDYG